MTLGHRADEPDLRRRPRGDLHPGPALDLAERFDPSDVGVVVDTFHLWWEPGIADQMRRAGDRIVSYQVCDWITPLPADTLLARGMMGDGHIDFAAFTRAVAAGRLSRATSRWRSSTPTCGRNRRPRSWTPWCSATSSWSSRT